MRVEPEVTSLTWDQVCAFRLRRHGLIGPQADDPVGVASRISGVHAQVMSSAELAIGLRTSGIRRSDVGECLWQHRTLLKMWAMRGTLHLLPTSEIDIWSAALSSHRHYMEDGWVGASGLTTDDIVRVTEALRRATEGHSLTRGELIVETSAVIKDSHLLHHLRSGWGSLLKPASYKGYLCFGPNRGRNVTFTSPSSIRGQWKQVDETEAIREVTRKHLRAYGPTTHARFAVWWGTRASRARAMFEGLGTELALVDVEGLKEYVLATDLPAILNAPPLDSILLLGAFDPYTVALCTSSQLLLPDPGLKSRVSRTAGWISPVVLVNGRIVGTWIQQRHSKRLHITVDPFVKVTAPTRKRIGHEAQRIGAFFDMPVDVEFGS